jgi:Fe2+ or Zn2+ uptake regulation protein
VKKAAKALPVAEQLEWALDFCSARGMRRTKALRALLAHLLKARRPMSWATLSRERSIAKVCDPSSAFRVLVKLEEIGLVSTPIISSAPAAGRLRISTSSVRWKKSRNAL